MPVSALEHYLADLARLRAQPESTPELSLREPLLVLVRELAARVGRTGLLIAPEADAERAGQPDVFIKSGPRLVGFMETKAPGTDIGAWLRNSDQARRYRDSLPNWIATDYYRFVTIRDGLVEDSFELPNPSGVPQLLPPVAQDELEAFVARFLAYSPPVIRSPRRLALELARRARLLRDGIAGVLATTETGDLRGVYDFYRDTLISDLDPDSFSDTFAQTIAYGLFLARLRDDGQDFTLARAIDDLPQSVPFLQSAMRLLTEADVLPRAITNLVDDLVSLLDNTDVGAIRTEIEAGGLEHDLVIYFYERFLEQYDAGERRRRGVYYTPPALVEYLVRATDTVLKEVFRLERGLADEVVTVLDPAVGTGTFLLGAAERALATAAEGGSATQRRLIREHLLPDFYGFELLAAPYTIAHLKLSSFYSARGYDLADDERIRIYLTNALEPHELGEADQLSFLPMIRGIVDEANAAGHVKNRIRVLAVLGNPPYERTSHNANPHSDGLLRDFYELEGTRLTERNTGPLQDDYLRFLRWSVWKLLEQEAAPGHGVIALVTNRAYLERKLHRAVRHFLLRKFDDIYVFDLHGDQREWFAGRVDEKVFKQVQAGIALTVFVKRPQGAASPELAQVHYRDAFGRREDKYEACVNAAIDDDGWEELTPRTPLWLFVPYDVPAEYESWPSVDELFPLNVVGFQTHRDQLVVAPTEVELRERLRRFADPAVPDATWVQQRVRTNPDWDLPKAREKLREEAPRRVQSFTFRGLERQWIAFDERLIDRIRTTVSPHLLEREDNLALAFANGSLPDAAYTVVSRTPVPAAALSWRTFGTAYFAPLWLHDSLSDEWRPNIAAGLFDRLRALGIECAPEGLFAYVYAVLNWPDHRRLYADALRYEFARIPFASNADSFARVREIGADLLRIHLLEHPDLVAAFPVLDGADDAVIENPRYEVSASAIYLAPTLTAQAISPEVWRYQQGAYPIVRNFLQAREGRQLTSDEFVEFRRLVAAVRLTLDRLPRLDESMPSIVATALTADQLLDRVPASA